MGVRCFGSSSSFDGQVVAPKDTMPNPDPSNFHINKTIHIGDYIILVINYPDCTNYEGDKILVFDDARILTQKIIDPHFSKNTRFASPIARIKPTDEGLDMAIKMCKGL